MREDREDALAVMPPPAEGEALMALLTELRRRLHGTAELAGAETETAARVEAWLRRCEPDALITGLGGQGLAAVFAGPRPGPVVLLRAELDAVPLTETPRPHACLTPGAAHACGHDGHMAILCGVAAALAHRRPRKGQAVLLFQPAEETGAGARALLDDPRFGVLRPDLAYALHNLPGYPLGQVLLRPGVMACASRGLALRLRGTPAHAAWPEQGRSPARAVAQLMDGLLSLPRHSGEPSWVTVVHAQLGQPVFGTAPAEGVVMATLRTVTDAAMEQLAERALALARSAARADGLLWGHGWQDSFAATVNDAAAVARVRSAAASLHLPLAEMAEPLRASEDFGALLATVPGALIGLGAGEDHPGLHTVGYDFPEALLPPGVGLLRQLLAAELG